MIKRYSIVLLLFVILSCKSKEEKLFFDFDSIEYYSLNKSKDKEIVENDKRDSVFEKILYIEFPKELNNEEFLKAINSHGFSKFELSQKDVDYLRNDVFIDKSSLKMFEYVKACAPEYRDVLVFKKNNQVSGIVKICLFCGQFYLISSKKEIQTDNFGTEEDYKSLEKLFQKYKNDKTKND